ncbi:uncharacterized protein LOC133497631 isoform X2 [Syngnathoides biaculeatus]|uniref:uncharacterized protein LOC133497631 isoform X2 n=1 Tax=Syngnathoides biaculeatus TaxID=300417 RepID=UPI002ADDDDE2|nr:uncharacterized protein LOC133497631 isoform X2 [Syngnathoides biaculeatus]
MSASVAKEECEGGRLRTKKEKERQRRLLDAGFQKPTDVLRGADVGEDHPRPERRQPPSPNVKGEAEERAPPRVKEEEQEADVSAFPLTRVNVKSEEDDGEGRRGASRDDSLLPPLSDSDDLTSHSSETDDDERSQVDSRSKRWKCSQCKKTFVAKYTLKPG